jgi:uncharacterized protein YegP (UPF0339 family)
MISGATRSCGCGFWKPASEGRVMASKFELYQDKQDKYRFRLKAGNGEIIAVSEAYNSRSSAINGIESVRNNAAAAALDDQTTA